jgi:hypothetical protein
MNMNKLFLAATLVIILLTGIGGVYADRPDHDTNGNRHPNLTEAQQLLDQAVDKINAAQRSNEFDVSGHAQNAKELVDRANTELKAAAARSDDHRHHDHDM